MTRGGKGVYFFQFNDTFVLLRRIQEGRATAGGDRNPG